MGATLSIQNYFCTGAHLTLFPPSFGGIESRAAHNLVRYLLILASKRGGYYLFCFLLSPLGG
jgi:hypothetical protein